MSEEQRLAKHQHESLGGREPLFAVSTTLRLVLEARGNGFATVGLDGFVKEGLRWRPDLDAIADFSSVEASSWRDRCDRCFDEARGFLNAMASKGERAFSVTLMSEDEWNEG